MLIVRRYASDYVVLCLCFISGAHALQAGPALTAERMLRDVFRLLALTGPCVRSQMIPARSPAPALRSSLAPCARCLTTPVTWRTTLAWTTPPADSAQMAQLSVSALQVRYSSIKQESFTVYSSSTAQDTDPCSAGLHGETVYLIYSLLVC